jgi:hypothetical protein
VGISACGVSLPHVFGERRREVKRSQVEALVKSREPQQGRSSVLCKFREKGLRWRFVFLPRGQISGFFSVVALISGTPSNAVVGPGFDMNCGELF